MKETVAYVIYPKDEDDPMVFDTKKEANEYAWKINPLDPPEIYEVWDLAEWGGE